MKKVKDYFKLPVTGQQIVDQYSGDITWFKATEEDEAIAHAINHADALAEALEALILSCHVTGSNILACTYAEAALAAYRGEA